MVMASFSTSDSFTSSSPVMEGTEAEFSDKIGIDLEEVVETEQVDGDTRQWALEWLSSNAAKEYEGRWVALGPDKQVIASGMSPSALKKAVDDSGDLVILYVIPENAQVIGGGRFVAFTR
jgi:hypothetical protein